MANLLSNVVAYWCAPSPLPRWQISVYDIIGVTIGMFIFKYLIEPRLK